MKYLLILILLMSASVASSAQTRKKSTKTEKPVVLGTVTIKGEPYVPPVYPSETDAGIWNEFSTMDGSIKVNFPAFVGKLYDDSERLDNGQRFISLSAYTKNGTYKLLARPFQAITENRDIDSILENTIRSVVIKSNLTVVRKKNIFYQGFIGKELIYTETVAEGIHIRYARFCILNSHVISLDVSLNDPTSKEKMEPWIQKFFNSLRVELPNINDA